MPSFQTTAFIVTLFVEPHPTWEGVPEDEQVELHYLEAQYQCSQVVADKLALGFTAQLERCPNTGRLHLQGALRTFKRETAVAAAKRLRDYDPYWQSVHLVGTPVVDLPRLNDYASKTESRAAPNLEPFTFGTVVSADESGRVSDTAIADAVRGGATYKELLDTQDWFQLARLGNTLTRAMAVYGKERDASVTPQVYLFIGESGTGKTWCVRELVAELKLQAYWLPLDAGGNNTFVTDEIVGAQALVLEDFRGQGLQMTQFLNLVDRGQFKMQTKGGFANVSATVFFITSNVEPESWWSGVKEKDPNGWEEKMKAVKRRLNEWQVKVNYKLRFRAWRLMEQRMSELAHEYSDDVASRHITPVRVDV